jgi:hypothetical protein
MSFCHRDCFEFPVSSWKLGRAHLEGLFVRLVGLLVDDLIVLGPREMFMLKGIERALGWPIIRHHLLTAKTRFRSTHPLAVDGHLRVGINAQIGDLGDIADALHVGGVAAGTENDCNTRPGVDVGRGDERAGGVVDDSSEADRHALSSR